MFKIKIVERLSVWGLNNCGKFYFSDFDRFYKDHGIERHKKNPYTPQQKGFVERMNMMLMERDRSMSSVVGLCWP
jgi:2-hydroxychromene-2-carboxylate isomerase